LCVWLPGIGVVLLSMFVVAYFWNRFVE
jgi:hypothetical protein